MMTFSRVLLLVPALAMGGPAAETPGLGEIFKRRGFDSSELVLPGKGEDFPLERLKDLKVEPVVSFKGFPEGPSYRPADGSYFFTGNVCLRRLDAEGKLHFVLDRGGGGGTHLLPDGSLLLAGNPGLRRVMPDGKVLLITDGEKLGGKNDLTVGIYGEIYLSVPRKGVYRVTPGKDGKVEKVTELGANGLDVDPSGKYLYVNQGGIGRYEIHGVDQPLGEREQVFQFEEGKRGLDGCTFDAWGNLYTMVFGIGTLMVVDPEEKRLLAEIPTGVEPASNVTFGGADNRTLFMTAGAPRLDNCQVLKIDLGITGFCGHPGATEYPVLRELDYRADVEAFSPIPSEVQP